LKQEFKGEIMQAKSIGKCIYCFTTENLEREHVIPFGLNGTMVLRDASCRSCAAITGSFEGDFLNKTLAPLREVLKINTRNKKKRTGFLPMKFKKNGKEFIQDVPLDEYIALVPALYIEYPSYLKTGVRNYVGDGTREAKVIGKGVYYTDDQVDVLKKKYGADSILISYEFSPADFGRMMAKIAYCFAIARFGIDGITDNYVIPAILGTSNDLWHFVGCDENYQHINDRPAALTHLKKKDALIWGDLTVVNGDIIVRIRILPRYDFPVYVIAVGKIREALRGMLQSIGWNNA
jgi:hypothetical protein